MSLKKMYENFLFNTTQTEVNEYKNDLDVHDFEVSALLSVQMYDSQVKYQQIPKVEPGIKIICCIKKKAGPKRL